MARVEQRGTATLHQGLFLVRYVNADDRARPPKIRVTAEREQEHDFLMVVHPDHADAVLSQPGACLLVMASEAGELTIEVTPSHHDGSSAATVQIEPLTPAESKTHPEITESAIAKSGVRVLGHVAGIGDVFVGADEWIAGPSAPARIEGIAIEWPDKPRDITLRYSVKTAKPHAASGRMMDLATYAGSRGRAMPIVGVVLELSGRNACRHEIYAEAIFLGSPRIRATGQRTVLAGPTGREPLVGFRVQMRQLKEQAVSTRLNSSASDRMRIFRSGTQSAQAVAT